MVTGVQQENNGCSLTSAANNTYSLDKRSSLAKSGLCLFININKATLVAM